MRMATKSTLNNDLRINVSGKQTTVIYDVSVLLWTISWPSNAGNLGVSSWNLNQLLNMALLREMLCWFLTGITPTVQNHTCACSVRKKMVEVMYTSSLLKCAYHLKPQSSVSLKIRCSLIRCLLVPWWTPSFIGMPLRDSFTVACTDDVPVQIVGVTVIERRDLEVTKKLIQ